MYSYCEQQSCPKTLICTTLFVPNICFHLYLVDVVMLVKPFLSWKEFVKPDKKLVCLSWLLNWELLDMLVLSCKLREEMQLLLVLHVWYMTYGALSICCIFVLTPI